MLQERYRSVTRGALQREVTVEMYTDVKYTTTRLVSTLFSGLPVAEISKISNYI